MIQIVFSEPASAEWKRWRADCTDETQRLAKAQAAGGKLAFGSLYRHKTAKKIYFQKSGPFHGKCAYCECYLEDFQHGDVEHFRPKGAVTDEHHQPVKVDDGAGGQRAHPGYWWLAYDWTNLLPACVDCNQPGEGGRGKRNRFPVEGKHATKPGEEVHEKPLLIHPVREDPTVHLSVDLQTGLLEPTTPKGTMTITVLGLNVRDRLPEERRKTVSFAMAQFHKLCSSNDPKDQAEALQELRRFQDGTTDYSCAGRAHLAHAKKQVALLNVPEL